MSDTETQEIVSPRIGLLKSTGICILFLGVEMTALAVQSAWEVWHGWQAWFGLLCQGTALLVLTAFVLRVLRWVRWSSLLLSILPIFMAMAVGAVILMCHLSSRGFDLRWVFTDIGYGGTIASVVVVLAIVPVTLGLLFGRWVDRRVKTDIIRKRLVVGGVLAVALVGLGPTVHERCVVWYTGSHAEIAGVPALSCNANSLHHTVVTPTLDCPIVAGTNVLWCATMPAAWNVLADYCGGTVDIVNPPSMVVALNRRDVTANVLDSSTFVADAGPGEEVISRVRSQLQAKFHGQASPELLPPVVSGLIAYAYLFVNLPFETAFERLDHPLMFGTNAVQAFGLNKPQSPGQRRAADQVVVYGGEEGEGGLVVELLTRRTDHQLVLALVEPGPTMEATITNVMRRLESVTDRKQHDFDLLQAPIMNFDILRDYDEIAGSVVQVRGVKAREIPLVSAKQQIRFRLDERGAVLKSEVAFSLGSPGALCFSRPFLILLRHRGQDKPYFAAWVDNAEILVPAK